MLQARSELLPHVKWILGNGNTCNVSDEPWFQNWLTIAPVTHSQRKLKVNQLWGSHSGTWDVARLTETLGSRLTSEILQQYSQHEFNIHIEDRLVFTYTQNGVFTVRSAYRLLAEPHHHSFSSPLSQSRDLWATIWQAEGVTSRVQLFLWRAIHQAIPAGSVLSRRLPRFDSTCPLCGAELESVLHILFQCPHARAVWFHSVLGIKIDLIPGDRLHLLLMDLWRMIGTQHISHTMLILWQIWKSRCSTLYAGKSSSPVTTIQAVQAQMHTIQRANFLRSRCAPTKTPLVPNQVNPTPFICWVDGSYKEPNEGGVGSVIKSSGTLVRYDASHELVFSPFHMEALAY